MGLRHFLGRALRLGQARGPSAAVRTDYGIGRCGHMTNFTFDACTKLIEEGVGGPKIVF